jgi:hypothetical protein
MRMGSLGGVDKFPNRPEMMRNEGKTSAASGGEGGRGPFPAWSCSRSLYWDHPTPLTAPSQSKNGLAPVGPPICPYRLEKEID